MYVARRYELVAACQRKHQEYSAKITLVYGYGAKWEPIAMLQLDTSIKVAGLQLTAKG